MVFDELLLSLLSIEGLLVLMLADFWVGRSIEDLENIGSSTHSAGQGSHIVFNVKISNVQISVFIFAHTRHIRNFAPYENFPYKIDGLSSYNLQSMIWFLD